MKVAEPGGLRPAIQGRGPAAGSAQPEQCPANLALPAVPRQPAKAVAVRPQLASQGGSPGVGWGEAGGSQGLSLPPEGEGHGSAGPSIPPHRSSHITCGPVVSRCKNAAFYYFVTGDFSVNRVLMKTSATKIKFYILRGALGGPFLGLGIYWGS